MIFFIFYFILLFSIPTKAFFGENFNVVISSNSPVVVGANVRFIANITDSKGNPATGKFIYYWNDGGIPMNSAEHKSESSVDFWNVTYSIKNYPPGKYIVQVVVKKLILFLYEEVASQRVYFELTKYLNGELKIYQNDKNIDGEFLSSMQPVSLNIYLIDADAEYLKNATAIITYWFIDCEYLGPSSTFNMTYNFTVPEKEHNVDVLVVASFDKDLNSTLDFSPLDFESSSASIISNHSIINNTNSHIISENSNATSSPNKVENKMLIINRKSGGVPRVCQNTTVTPDEKKGIGYFNRNFTVKAPVSNVTITGNNWLEHGDMLSLTVKCEGSAMFSYCVHWPKGPYNITGNESCLNPDTSQKCEFPIRHYFQKSQVYTVVVVIYNVVSKSVSPVTVTVYKVNKQGQLSVIIVPVTFSLVSVVLIVFGIAYYLQNRSRFIVEVADFNFGQKYADMEYKTFTERLREAISTALIRTPTPSSSEHSVWPPGQKYGSLS